MIMNVSTDPEMLKLSELFSALSNPARLQILLVIGSGQACVCHMRSALGLRQAYLSQQLMALRKAGLLDTTREGRHIYYRLADPSILALVKTAACYLQITLPAYPVEEIPGCAYKTE